MAIKKEYTQREVIQNKLLTALKDESVVAALLTVEDLNALIAVCQSFIDSRLPNTSYYNRIKVMMADLRELRKSAFNQ